MLFRSQKKIVDLCSAPGGKAAQLAKAGKIVINLRNINLLGKEEEFKKNIFVKVRSTGKLLDAKVSLKEKNNAEVKLILPEEGISPGQACVFYNKDNMGHKVLGGGWISN